MSAGKKQIWVMVATVVIFAGVGVCAYWALTKETSPPVAAPLQENTDPRPESPPVQAPDPEPATVTIRPEPSAQPEPPLTEERIRQLAGKLSSHPEIARWLVNEHLTGKFTAVVEMVRNGHSPRKVLGFLKPQGRFAVIEQDGREFLDPKSYRRYDLLAGAIASLDVEGCARLLGKLESRLESAYRELGPPNKGFRWAWTQALTALLQVPAIDGHIPLNRIEVTLKIASPELESMTDAQKHLFRMGPANIRKIQATLRQIHRALGWSADLAKVQPISYSFLPQAGGHD